VLQGLIHQVIVRRRKLFKLARRPFESLSLQSFRSFSELWTLFERLVSHPKIGSVYLVIDAIDECRDRNVERFLESLLHLMSRASGTLKLLLACQPGASAVSIVEANFPGAMCLRMERKQDAIGEDVNLLIQRRIERMVAINHCSKGNAAALQQTLRSKSGGSFLWVSMVLSMLEQRKSNIRKCDVDEISAEGHLPADLSKLYERCLCAIPKEEQEYARRMLYMLLASVRPLLITEISPLMAIRATDLSMSDVSRRDEGFGVQSIERLLGPLVRTSGHAVLPVHQTLVFYLSNQLPAQTSDAARFFVEGKRSIQFEIAQSCMRYLLLDGLTVDVASEDSPLSTDSPTTFSTKQDGQDQRAFDAPGSTGLDLATLFKEEDEIVTEDMVSMAHRYELFEYAARYWTFHFLQCHPMEQELLQDLATTLVESKGHSQWLAYLVTVNRDIEQYPRPADALVVAAFFGLQSIVKYLLTDQKAEASIGPAVYWAACQGHQSCLEALLLLGSIDVASTYRRSASPLAVAASNGHLDCVHSLLGSRKLDVNEQTVKGRTPLSLAAGAGHQHTVARLLEEDGIDVNLADNNGASPVFWAAANDADSTVECLLAQPFIDLRLADYQQQNVLFWACAEGSAKATKALLKDLRCNPNMQNYQGRTPLMLAVAAEDLSTVQAMVRCQSVQLAIQDNNGRNAISWAAQRSDSRILQCLLKRGQSHANVRDHDGWGPLAWTMDPPAKLDNARILLSYASEEINVPDTFGTPIVILALVWGSPAIAQLLASSDKVHVGWPDSSGRSALTHAVKEGYTELVHRILVREPSLVDIPDNAGHTPLDVAAKYANADIYDMLAKYGKSRGEH